jgi:hypothetical protein
MMGVPSEVPSVAEKAIELILELSADLQIKRRATAKYSFEFQEYSTAIAAYGEVLELLTGLQLEELYAPSLGLLGLLDSSAETPAVV